MEAGWLPEDLIIPLRVPQQSKKSLFLGHCGGHTEIPWVWIAQCTFLKVKHLPKVSYQQGKGQSCTEPRENLEKRGI